MCPTKQKHRTKISSTNDEQESNNYDWREETINGGSLRRVDLIAGSNGWASPPGNLFSLRSKQYLTKKIKSPAGEYLFKPTAVDWLKSSTRLDNVLGRSDNRVSQSLIKAHSLKKALKTFIFAVNLQIPGKDQYSAVFYFSTDEPIQPGSLLYRFINGDDQFRNQRFKLVNRIVKGPWIVKAAVGNYAACLLGKAVTCRYFRGENYLEIDVDIGSSAIARTIVHLAIGHVRSVTIDMGFVVEGQEVEELPEKLMGAVRICQMEMGSATVVEAEDAAAVAAAAAVGKSGCGGGSSKVNNHEEEDSC